jgi:hypothetical protein
LASGVPGDVVITTMTLAPGNGSWRVTVNGQAHAETPALAQALFTRFLRGASSSPLLGQPVRPPSMSVQAYDPADAGPETLEPSGPAAALATPHDEVDALARPRNVILTEPGGAPVNDPRAARPRQVAAEPHWQLHPGGVPKAVANGIAAYNTEQAGQAQAAQRTAALPAAPVERRAGSVLEFSVEFEVRK